MDRIGEKLNKFIDVYNYVIDVLCYVFIMVFDKKKG